MLRIGYDAKRAFNNFTGLGNYSRFLIRSMLRLYPDNKYFLFTPDAGKGTDPFTGEDVQPEVITSPMPGILKKMWRVTGITGAMRARNLDVFHGLSNELPYGINKLNTGKVVTIHDLIFLNRPEMYASWDRKIYWWKTKYAAEVADKIIATSYFTRDEINKYLDVPSEKVEVIYQDCSQAFKEKVTEPKKAEIQKKYGLPETFVLCVGTLETRKNQKVLLEALSRMDHPVPLVFIGKETGYKAELDRLIANKGMERYVTFLQNVPSGDLPSVYQMASVFAYPSYVEGFGIPVLEALNSGVPVITSENTCLEEVGGDAAVYVDPADYDSVGNALEKVMTNHGKREDMIGRGYRQAKKFSPEENIPALHKIYYECAQTA